MSVSDSFEPPVSPALRRRRLHNRVVLAVVGVLLITAAGFGVRTLLTSCGGPGSGVRVVDDQCVGVTDGSYVFNEAYRAVQKKIAAENARVDDIVNDPQNNRGRAVTVALLNPMTVNELSAFSVDEVRNLLEGAYTAQYRANQSRDFGDRDPLIRLVLANEGSNQRQWRPVVDQLVDMKDAEAPLNAVVGLGVSIDLTEQAAKKLAEHEISMVGAIVTADRLNYENILGFVRVSPSNRDYVAALREYLQRRPELDSAILVYDDNAGSRGDIFVDSLRDDITSEMQDLIEFDPQSFVGKSIPSDTNPSLFNNTIANICAEKPKVVFFAGRKVDLRDFLGSLGSRVCRNDQVTVVTVDADPNVFGRDEQALRDEKITVIYADATNPRGWVAGVPETPPNFPEFKRWFEDLGFPLEHLDDGGAISHHDAVLTAAKAIRLAALPSSSDPPGAADVRSQLLNLNTTSTVPGASGTLRFSDRDEKSGDPVGKPIPVLEFPSSGTSPGASGDVYVTE
ncbi:MAG: ABC transporter substrate-binding protein [Actinomycetota bacterium]|nr:ABC transporter substrate-binding protein [Actinomycetota bacterium]